MERLLAIRPFEILFACSKAIFAEDCLLSHQWGSSEILHGDIVRARKTEAGRVLVCEGRDCPRIQ